MEEHVYRQEPKQIQKLSQRMLQSLRVLQMTSAELSSYLNDEFEKNPVLELLPGRNASALAEKLRSHTSPVRGSAVASTEDGEGSGEALDYAATEDATGSLTFFLFDQLDRLALPTEQERLCKYLVLLLDENGFLSREELSGAAGDVSAGPGEMETALRVLQSLEPAGIGARDAMECLSLQLRRLPEPEELALSLVREENAALLRLDVRQIARRMHCTSEEAGRALALIRGLHPYPAAEFQKRGETVYITPDAYVFFEEEGYTVILGEYYDAAVGIDPYYREIYETTQDEPLRDYLKAHLSSAAWTIQSIARRRDTMLRCVQTVAEMQADYLSGAAATPVPMALADVAKRVELHESTVSRALGGKYMQCERGLVSFRSLLGRPVASGAGMTSASGLRREIARLLREEDAAAPLSDQSIADTLSRQGWETSRRTVAKYRDEMGIANTAVRRKRG